MDCSPPGSSAHGILQARMLEWFAIPFSRGCSRPRDGTRVRCISGRFLTIWVSREAHADRIYLLLCYYDSKCISGMEVKNRGSVSHSVLSDSLRPHGLYPARLLCPWNSPGKNTGVGNNSLLQGIFLTQGSNLELLHFRQILYCLSHQGSP